MKRRWLSLLLLPVGLLALQQLLSGFWRLGIVAEQSKILRQDEIEPSALFYTDCPQALRAEKIIRNR